MISPAEKRRAMQHYEKLLSTMLSDADIQHFIGGSTQDKILKYSELADYDNINQLMPDDKDFRIILTESKRNQGHWCCLLKYPTKNGDVIEWFDSYSGKPDSELKFIPERIRRMLGETEHHLTRLLKTADDKQSVIYNKKKFQSLADNVDTCGRWVVARILMNQFGYTLEDFINKLEQIEDETGKPYDIIVCDWIH
jgi:hypothetical protein